MLASPKSERVSQQSGKSGIRFRSSLKASRLESQEELMFLFEADIGQRANIPTQRPSGMGGSLLPGGKAALWFF